MSTSKQTDKPTLPKTTSFAMEVMKQTSDNYKVSMHAYVPYNNIIFRVATVREKVKEKKIFKIMEK